MAVEEPSVIAAASNAARMVREGGGFAADADESIMTTQVELRDVADPVAASAAITNARAEILASADQALPRLRERGGGCRDLEIRTLPDQRLVVHLYVDCRDAMGANMVNTVAEAVAGRLAELASARVGLRILRNLCDRRMVRVFRPRAISALCQPTSPWTAAPMLAREHRSGLALRRARPLPRGHPQQGHHERRRRGRDRHRQRLARRRGRGSRLRRPRRALPAARHLARGRRRLGRPPGACPWPSAPWAARCRSIPARDSRCASSAHPRRASCAEVIGSVGLAQNLAALKALAGEGIQRGHMALHRRAVSER